MDTSTAPFTPSFALTSWEAEMIRSWIAHNVKHAARHLAASRAAELNGDAEACEASASSYRQSVIQALRNLCDFTAADDPVDMVLRIRATADQITQGKDQDAALDELVVRL